MTIGEGDELKYKFTGQLYRVKIIKNGTFVLESEDTLDRMWIGGEDLDLFFEMTEKEERQN
jgi:hypothetical protein